MAILSENMVFSKTRTQDLRNVKQLNCWGSELTDVSIVRQMPYVQVLSLSVNNITSLEHFGACKNLQELYLRENKIKDLMQVSNLQELAHLKKLWLSGNPCTDHSNYRMTVLKTLPNLEMLDNIVVTPEEVAQAEEVGDDLNSSGSCSPPSERRNSANAADSSPHQRAAQNNGHHEQHYDDQAEEEGEDGYDERRDSEFLRHSSPGNGNVGAAVGVQQQQQFNNQSSRDSPRSTPASSPQQQHQNQSPHGQPRVGQQRLSQPDLGSQQSGNGGNGWNGSQGATRPPPAHLSGLPVPSVSMVRSASINDYSTFNGSNGGGGPGHERSSNDGSYYKNDSSSGGGGPMPPTTNGGSCVKPGFQRLLPKGGRNRNANILSAVLCLIKELDSASLEVVDTEIHCRMEEMGN